MLKQSLDLRKSTDLEKIGKTVALAEFEKDRLILRIVRKSRQIEIELEKAFEAHCPIVDEVAIKLSSQWIAHQYLLLDALGIPKRPPSPPGRAPNRLVQLLESTPKPIDVCDITPEKIE